MNFKYIDCLSVIVHNDLLIFKFSKEHNVLKQRKKVPSNTYLYKMNPYNPGNACSLWMGDVSCSFVVLM